MFDSKYVYFCGLCVYVSQKKLSETNFLFEADRIAQEISAVLLEEQKMAIEGDCITVPHTTSTISNSL